MSEHPKNNLSDLFKKRFEEESSQDLGWNTPPDFLFEDAIAVVNREKSKKRRNLLYFVIAIGLVGLFSTLHYYSSSKFADLESKILELEAVQVHNSAQDVSPVIGNLTETYSIDKVIDQNIEQVSPSTKEVVNNEVQYQPISKENKLDLVTAQHRQLRPVTRNFQGQASTQNHLASSQRIFENKTNKSPLSQGLKVALLSGTANITSKPLSQLVSESTMDIDYSSGFVSGVVTNDIEERRPKSVLSVLYRNNYSAIRTSGEIEGTIMSGAEDFYNGSGLAITYSHPVSKKFSLLGGVALDKILNKTSIKTSRTYDKANENSIGQNLVEFEMPSTIESPFGSFDDTVILILDPRAANQDDVVEHNTSLIQKASVLNFSLGAQYHIIDNEKFQWNISTSAGLSYILQLETDVQSSFKMQDRIMGTVSENVTDKLNTTFATGEVQTSFSYNLRNNWRLQIGGGYQMGLSDIRNDLNSSFSSKLHMWHTSIGLSKSF